jgi:hypothetical protein
LTTIGWAGTAREATTDRMDHAGTILHEIMAAPDNGIPEEVLEHAKCVAQFAQGWIRVWCREWPRCSHLPDG